MKTDIIIVGAGIIGMTMAIALSKNNKKVIVIEKNLSKSIKINRIYSLSQKTKFFLESINIWKDIEGINTLSSMSIFYRYFSKDNMVDFSKELSNSDIGFIAQSKFIMSALLEHSNSYENFQLIDNSEVKILENNNDKVKVTLNNNETVEAKYLFSCEGSKSNIKKNLSIDSYYDNYDSKALVFNINHTITNKSTAYQIFLESGPIAFLPIDNKNLSIVLSIKNRFLNDIKLDKKYLESYLAELTNNKFGKLSIVTDIVSFDLVGYDSKEYKFKKVLFVGDSAHAVHPLAGMGLNLGISDIIEITEILKNSKQKFGNKNFFSSYARSQKIVNKKARQQLKFIEKIYSVENRIIKNMIRISMENIQKSQFIKNKIIKHANNNINFF